MTQENSSFDCVLKVVSPVHLGCGEVYEPTCFTVDEENNEMTVFDPIFFIADMEEEERLAFSGICRKGTVESILELYNFLRKKKPQGRTVALCNGFVDHYRKVLALNPRDKNFSRQLNQFQIERTAFRPADQRPYIPGSAIKGALRTAYANMAAGVKKTPPEERRKGGALEKILLEYDPGRTETDPFRMVKVSDFQPAGYVAAKVVYAVNKKKSPGDKNPRGIAQIMEVIEPGAIFCGRISVDRGLGESVISNPASLEKLLEGAVRFYAGQNKRELSELSRAGLGGVEVGIDENRVPMRIGRHSGAECLTIEGHRSIRINTGKKKQDFSLDHATTVWLASETSNNQYNKGLRPFGWVQLQPMTGELEKKISAFETDFQQDREIALRRRQEEAERIRSEKEQERIAEEQRRQEQERKEREAAEEQAALEAMTPEEREIYELQQPGVSEEKMNIAFKKIDEYSPEGQKAVAAAIKAYWQASNKWVRKDFSQKQWKVAREKIAKIQSILGEK
ncbi:MAG: type III-A CRISPR-associated RAMP protein Csm5 [Desulfobacteraceae bacterium]|nr:type III-A CRISPR-associated RAMP protein Csm5 [Desulfobacteraceae bacterium]